MRGIGNGQRIHIIVIAEIMKLMKKELSSVKKPLLLDMLNPGDGRVPIAVAAWLTINRYVHFIIFELKYYILYVIFIC